MTLIVELLPIGTLLALLTTQVLETALAAQDVLIEKESFKCLAKYLQDVQPVLAEMTRRDMRDSSATRQALESLKDDIVKANKLINDCKTKPRFFLLVNCRRIVKQLQDVTRDIGRSLELLGVAIAEVSVDIRDNVVRLKNSMMAAEFETSASGKRVLEKLDLGVQRHETDQGFANDLIREIAMAVGVPVNDSHIRRELASFKREKEEAAERKEREEEAFMEQVIALLERSDAAKEPQDARNTYWHRQKDIGSSRGDYYAIPALQSFICPLKQDVMEDPVTVATGQTYEREQIDRWFSEGHTKDPLTGQELPHFELRPNGALRKSIEEWQERNFWASIDKAKQALERGDDSEQVTALEDLQLLCQQDSRNRDRIATREVLSDIVRLKSHNRDVKTGCLSAMSAIVHNHDSNKEKLAEAGGVGMIVRWLSRDDGLSRRAVKLLLELLQCKDGVNQEVGRRIGQEKGAILLLVTLGSNTDSEAVNAARTILEQLSDTNENVVQMAQANWYKPLVDRLREGSDESKLAMAKALSHMELTEQGKRKLGEEGVISTLADMLASSKIELKTEALGALRNLSTCTQNKEHIAETKAISMILDQLYAKKSPHMMGLAAVTLANLFANEGTQFLLDAGIDPGPVTTELLAIQGSSMPAIRLHVLHALLGLVSSPSEKEIVLRNEGIPQLMPLLESQDPQVRDCVVQLIYCLSDSQEAGAAILTQIQQRRMGATMVKFLQDGTSSTVQAAAAGILASFPREGETLVPALESFGAVTAIVAMVHNGGKVRENALAALLLFCQPSNVDMQRKVASLDTIPLLKGIVHSGSPAARARAARALGRLSASTVELSVSPDMRGCCFKRFKPARPAVCKVHQGKCDVKSTFCLVEAHAVQGLVNLFAEGGEAAEAGLEAVLTLVGDDRIVEKGVKFLDEFAGAIQSVVDLLARGTTKSKELAIDLLGWIFHSSAMRDKYGTTAEIHLAALAGESVHSIKRKAAELLGQLDAIQEQSTYF